MKSDDTDFWDQRYRREGTIWGDSPSPTGVAATQYLSPQARVLDVGFGYGRDLAFLLRHGCRAYGIDLSSEGRRLAEQRFRTEGFQAVELKTGRFEDSDLPDSFFDLLLSHRMAHLLITPQAISQFAEKAARVLRPGGILCVGARNANDLNPAQMIEVAEKVYEYMDRPGHRIRYWDSASFQQTFGREFQLLSLTQATEPESVPRPSLCYLTIMIGQKKDRPALP